MSGATRKKSWFFPEKYFHGLSAAATRRRKREIKKFGSMHWKNPKAYTGFATDRGTKKPAPWPSISPRLAAHRRRRHRSHGESTPVSASRSS